MLRRGVLRPGEDIVDGSRFDDRPPSITATRSANRWTMERLWVMKRTAIDSCRFQGAEKLENAGFHRDIKGRRRFIGDQEIRFAGQRHGDHDALALASRQRVGKVMNPVRQIAQSYEVHEFTHPPCGRLRRHALVNHQWLGDLPGNGMERIEGRHRLLEDHGNPVAAHPAQFALPLAREVVALEQDLTGRMTGSDKAKNGKGRDRLAGP